ncbi:diphosphomevalonate decarboxylase [Leucobacter sp. OH1287]|uniref:diphosphomevalonate decarboxylase n=1 Tax=Leucobacter sp. OH1287 TaxID=2491049 RepID=UPI000F6034D0|nr:diphosphomevalonate decarboxylase [Leucobacter sp. OH1287]RRD60149.1 diphosphomevalonate decarboxylase [Leucobacter sp. OH1287]
MRATAIAHPNIALIKYWGKRDEDLILPVAGSLSMTLDTVATRTTVTLGGERDTFTLNGEAAQGGSASKVFRFLDRVRSLAGSHTPAAVVSHNDAPTAAGLASSASGFAALALAASTAYGLELTPRELSRLARRGSGSACRSTVDRFAVWHAGTDDETSYAEQIDAPDMRMIVCEINAGPKAVSSRDGMLLTRDTSPFYTEWAPSTERALERMIAACQAGDFTRIGELTELHAMRMHALTMTTEPPLRYLAPASFAAFDAIAKLRADGVEAYGTADAGPNVVAISRPADAERVAAALSEFGKTHIAAPGRGAYLAADGSGEAA